MNNSLFVNELDTFIGLIKFLPIPILNFFYSLYF